MKPIKIIACLVVSTCLPLHGEGAESRLDGGEVESEGYSEYAIPINKEIEGAISLTRKRVDCSLVEFLKINGVYYPEGSRCSIDSKAGLFRLTSNHKSATMAVMIMGKMMIELSDGAVTPQQLANKYQSWKDDPFREAKPSQKQDGEQDGTGQPATRSKSDSEGGDKPQTESEGRSR